MIGTVVAAVAVAVGWLRADDDWDEGAQLATRFCHTDASFDAAAADAVRAAGYDHACRTGDYDPGDRLTLRVARSAPVTRPRSWWRGWCAPGSGAPSRYGVSAVPPLPPPSG